MSKLPEVMERIQRLNATVYWLTFSPFLEPFTVKAENHGRHQARSRAHQAEASASQCPDPDTRPAPADLRPGRRHCMQSPNWPG